MRTKNSETLYSCTLSQKVYHASLMELETEFGLDKIKALVCCGAMGVLAMAGLVAVNEAPLPTRINQNTESPGANNTREYAFGCENTGESLLLTLKEEQSVKISAPSTTNKTGVFFLEFHRLPNQLTVIKFNHAQENEHILIDDGELLGTDGLINAGVLDTNSVLFTLLTINGSMEPTVYAECMTQDQAQIKAAGIKKKAIGRMAYETP
jgi:hypothetical protein